MIREAEIKDREEIQYLYKQLCPDAPVNVQPERIEQLKGDSNNFLFVYEENGIVSGTVFITICLSPMFGFQPFAVLEYFIVNEKSRGQGIGDKLINHVFQVCRDNKCTVVLLLSSSHRNEAHHFFEKHGFDSSNKKGFVKYLNRKN